MRYYRVIKDTFLWEEGAIITNKDNSSDQYRPIDDIYKKFEDSNEYISAMLIEKNPEWFERVYAVNLLTKTVYKVKNEAKALLNDINKGL